MPTDESAFGALWLHEIKHDGFRVAIRARDPVTPYCSARVSLARSRLCEWGRDEMKGHKRFAHGIHMWDNGGGIKPFSQR